MWDKYELDLTSRAQTAGAFEIYIYDNQKKAALWTLNPVEYMAFSIDLIKQPQLTRAQKEELQTLRTKFSKWPQEVREDFLSKQKHLLNLALCAPVLEL